MIRRAALLLALTLTSVSPAFLVEESPRESSDGRFHACGVVTEDGVTEHLDAYARRCGK